MVVFEARLSNIRFNRTLGAFEAHISVDTADGLDLFAARAYLPQEAPSVEVRGALTEVARRRHEALRGGPDKRNAPAAA